MPAEATRHAKGCGKSTACGLTLAESGFCKSFIHNDLRWMSGLPFAAGAAIAFVSLTLRSERLYGANRGMNRLFNRTYPAVLLAAILSQSTQFTTAAPTESENFCVLGAADQALARQVIDACEQTRNRQFAFWFGEQPTQCWQPKCQIVIHATDARYLAAVGAGAGSTVASSLVDDRQGKIRGRRIDVRASRAGWLSALPHELTHVVLADQFAGKALPRWADEGMAILADSTDKQGRHRGDLLQALHQRQQFRLVELMEMSGYPSPSRWGCFYGQSASLAAHLIRRKSPQEFVRFVDLSVTRGHAAALESVYGIRSLKDLELSWLREAGDQSLPRSAQLAMRDSAIAHGTAAVE